MKGSKFSIGRSPDCDLRAKSSRISRHHCVILVEKQRVIVRDLGSRNGTFVNGEKIEKEHSLNHGDQLSVGRFELEVQITDDAKATAGSSPKPAAEPRATAKAEAEAAGISGIALSIMESPVTPSDDDDFELTGQTGESQGAAGPNDDESTQSFTWPKGQPASTEAEPPEGAEEPESPGSHDPAEYVVSEAEKQKARSQGAIVGVSKTTQAKRVTGTSNEAAAEALRKLYR
ncbi:MAG: FHA domain-containing protein [Pirellulales bacterium]|nr:FHA domain-containing protein [Pirellulales bacterium]